MNKTPDTPAKYHVNVEALARAISKVTNAQRKRVEAGCARQIHNHPAWSDDVSFSFTQWDDERDISKELFEMRRQGTLPTIDTDTEAVADIEDEESQSDDWFRSNSPFRLAPPTTCPTSLTPLVLIRPLALSHSLPLSACPPFLPCSGFLSTFTTSLLGFGGDSALCCEGKKERSNLKLKNRQELNPWVSQRRGFPGANAQLCSSALARTKTRLTRAHTHPHSTCTHTGSSSGSSSGDSSGVGSWRRRNRALSPLPPSDPFKDGFTRPYFGPGATSQR
jgi:hypothetical protein